MALFMCHQVTQIDWNPPSVVCVVEGEEPRNHFGKSIYVQKKICLSDRSDKYHHIHFQLQNHRPKLELGTYFSIATQPFLDWHQILVFF